ncbi:MAG: ABC transporter ATP-binding protein/permease, partial [Desulfobacterales bacterium]|nr:ABC transporter ATP-binding protein/permease [Desulfobacterales bacterium]
MDPKTKPTTFLQSYRAGKTIAGDNSPEYKRSMLLFVAAFTAEGLAYLCFFPLLSCLFVAEPLVGGAILWLVVMGLLAALGLYFRWYGHDFDFKGTIVDVAHRLRLELGEKLKSMPLEKLYSYKTGTLNNVLSVGVEYSVLSIGIVSSVIIQTVIPPVLLILVTFVIEWRLACAMLVLFCIAVPVQKWHRSGSSQGKIACGKALAQVESDVLEYVQGLPVLRSTNQTGERSVGLQAALRNHKKVQKKSVMALIAPMVVMSGIVEIGLLAVLTMGVFMIAQGSLALSVAAALLVIISRFSEPLSLFSSLTQVFDIVDAALIKISELRAIKTLAVSSPPTIPQQFDIEFTQVSFIYAKEDQYALQDVSFSIPAGKLTALVGPSGSGKTTI